MGQRQRDKLLKMFGKSNNGSSMVASSSPAGAKRARPQVQEAAAQAQPAQPQPPSIEATSDTRAFRVPGTPPAVAPAHRVVVALPEVSPAACDRSITDEDIQQAVRTLTKLHNHSDLFRTVRYKPLRAAVYPLVQPPAGGYVARISAAVSDGRWADAVFSLRAMRAAGDMPKLGSVQRWVRECDLAGADDTGGLRCLDEILRTAAPEQIAVEPTAGFDPAKSPPVVLREAPWAPIPLQASAPSGLDSTTVDLLKAKFRVLLREPAAKRRPPNQHDMVLYTCDDNTVPLLPPTEATVSKVDVPCVPDSFYLVHLLTPQEATSIVQIAEAIGMLPDVPLTGQRSILAHHFVWVADEAFMANVFERCRKFLPETIQGASLVGLNRRLRCYRYVPGSVYRPHVDGAWPMSGVDPEGRYVYDISKGRVTSKLTFLMYLNEGFDGGWTSYYTPAFEEGHLKFTPVVPRVGGCMVFPHADTAGCLVHEGSGVTKGTKYIIRTEVLYDVAPNTKKT